MGRTPDAATARGRQGRCMTTIADLSLARTLRAAGFVGRLVEPADAGYDAARATCVRLASPVDRAGAVAGPPQRLPEPVQRVGIARPVGESRCERVVRRLPVRLREV